MPPEEILQVLQLILQISRVFHTSAGTKTFFTFHSCKPVFVIFDIILPILEKFQKSSIYSFKSLIFSERTVSSLSITHSVWLGTFRQSKNVFIFPQTSLLPDLQNNY